MSLVSIFRRARYRMHFRPSVQGSHSFSRPHGFILREIVKLLRQSDPKNKDFNVKVFFFIEVRVQSIDRRRLELDAGIETDDSIG